MQYDADTLAKLVEEFAARQSLYREFGQAIEVLLKNRLAGTAVRDHIISSRPKAVDSFSRKIQRKNYRNPLTDITDLTGVRVTICYLDQLRAVEEIIFDEFEIDHENSIDRSKIYGADTFGYLSVHYIVSNSAQKAIDENWKRFNGIKAELQLRTTLQHAWALVNHALYKNESEIPKSLWRRLNRLSGLFELADQEFIEIRKQNERYRANIVRDFENNRIDRIEINYFTLKQYLSRNQVAITAAKAARDHNLLLEDNLQREYYDRMDSASVAEICKHLDIHTIADLSAILDRDKRGNSHYIEALSRGNTWKFTKPFIVFLLIVKARSADFPKDYLRHKYGWEPKTIDFVLHEALKANP